MDLDPHNNLAIFLPKALEVSTLYLKNDGFPTNVAGAPLQFGLQMK